VKTLVVCSGGLDSVTLAHKVAVEQTVIHPDYWCEARGAYGVAATSRAGLGQQTWCVRTSFGTAGTLEALRSPSMASREPRRLLSSTPFQSSSGECRLKQVKSVL